MTGRALVPLSARILGRGGGGRSLDRLNRPLGVQETTPYRLLRVATVLVSLAILAAVAWAGFAKVNVVTHAQGVLVPRAFEQQVQHLDGGMVQAILVKEGEVVEKGQALLRLTDAGTPQDLGVARQQRDELVARIAALEAVRDGRAPPDDAFADDPAAAAIAANARTAVARSESLAAERRQLESQIAEAGANIAAIRSEMGSVQQELALAGQERERYESLFSRGLTTITVLTQRQRAELSLSGRVRVLREQLSGAVARQSEARRAVASFQARSTLDLAEQIRDLRVRLVEVEGDLAKKVGRGDRLVVRAPVRGIVKKLSPESVGTVVAPGAPIAVIVPVDGPLYADTQVAARQVAYLMRGQPAKLKISAFDFTRYGWVDGRVEAISPSSFADERGERFYRVRVAIDRTTLPSVQGAMLMPGMEVSADIITGRKTILDYLLSPVRRGLDTAFTER